MIKVLPAQIRVRKGKNPHGKYRRLNTTANDFVLTHGGACTSHVNRKYVTAI